MRAALRVAASIDVADYYTFERLRRSAKGRDQSLMDVCRLSMHELFKGVHHGAQWLSGRDCELRLGIRRHRTYGAASDPTRLRTQLP